MRGSWGTSLVLALCWACGSPSDSGGGAGSTDGPKVLSPVGSGGASAGAMLAGGSAAPVMAGSTDVGGGGGAVGVSGTAGAGAAMSQAGAGGSTLTSGSGGASGAANAGSSAAGSGGSVATAGSGGSAGSGGAGSGGSAGTTAGDGEFDALRQACVDQINMYRATMSLPALARETPDIEACSDMGAKQDADTNSPHSSAGMCFKPPTYYGGGQNTCPSLPVGGFGSATLADSLKRCIDQMWAEGPPPAGTTTQQCIDDHAGCFLMHGHWINMIQTMYKSVSCGFYKKADGSYWGNQDYPIKP